MPSGAKSSIVDSGALIAVHDRQDQHHAWARRVFASLDAPWLTCEPALTETFFQLEKRPCLALSDLLRAGILRVAFDLEIDMSAVLNLMEKYADVPMSIADACLVRMSETLPEPVIITTDSDFRIYRRHGRRVVPVLMP